MVTKHNAIAAAAFAGALAMSGGSQAQTSGQPQAQPASLAVMVFSGVQNMPIIVAQTKGFFVKRGLNIEVLSAPSSDVLRNGLMEGKHHIVHGGVDNAVAMAEVAKADISILMGGDNGWNLYLEGFDRRTAMLWLIALFVFTLVLLSGWQGVKVALSIAISIAMIGYILIPLYLRGVNAVPLAIALSGLFTLISSGLTIGWNRKSLVVAIGTMGGALVAYLISLVFVDSTRLSGLGTEEDRSFFNKNPLLDPRGLLFAGIIIAAVGVLEDVAVSIASGVSEVRRANNKLSFKELFTAGMVIGKDHMGALANTLVFAYVGASLSTLLLYQQFGGSWLKFINFDSVTDEVVRSLAGTIGLVFTVPITALLAAWATLRAPIDSKGSEHRH